MSYYLNSGKRYVVRVVISRLAPEPFPDRHWFGVLDALATIGTIKVHRNDRDGACFDFLSPRGWIDTSSHTWAHRRAQRLTALGLNAVVAPEVP